MRKPSTTDHPCFLVLCLLVLGSIACRSAPSLPLQNGDRHGLALEGFDPVSYFGADGSPQRGSSDFSVRHDGLLYRFASLANLERFQRDPARFTPAYGGWCAYAMADGQRVSVDPHAYLIQNDRLLLFYRSFWNDTRKSWLNDPDDLARRADEHWARLAADR